MSQQPRLWIWVLAELRGKRYFPRENGLGFLAFRQDTPGIMHHLNIEKALFLGQPTMYMHWEFFGTIFSKGTSRLHLQAIWVGQIHYLREAFLQVTPRY